DTANDAELQRQIQDILEREQRMLQHPEYRDLLRARQRLSLTQEHPDLAEFLQIPKAQADQLIDLLAEHRVREQTEARAMWPSHVDQATVQGYEAKAQHRQRTAEAQLGAVRGPSKF